jgi:hypothetical protein
MPHGVESTITLSDRDLARGAIDLSMEEEVPALLSVNKTVLDTAVSIIREAGPKIVEVVTSHLTPVLSHNPVNVTPEVMVSSPIETVVIFPVPANSSHSIVPTPPDTVLYILFV